MKGRGAWIVDCAFGRKSPPSPACVDYGSIGRMTGSKEGRSQCVSSRLLGRHWCQGFMISKTCLWHGICSPHQKCQPPETPLAVQPWEAYFYCCKCHRRGGEGRAWRSLEGLRVGLGGILCLLHASQIPVAGSGPRPR